jgi:drug/metabolite transporter (DMT)-like permease
MKENKWLYLVVLSLMWGSSFILMKKALIGLTPLQAGAFRMLIAGAILISVGYKKIKYISKTQWKYIGVVAFTATFFPVFLFSYAISEIDSSVSAILNSLTPLITMFIGVLFFGYTFSRKQIWGVLIGLLGTVMLIVKGAEMNPGQNYYYAILIFIASMGYAYSLNVLKKRLSDLDALSITVGCFVLLFIPAALVLFTTGFFSGDFTNSKVAASLGYISLLAIFGTAIAKVLFNKLVQISTPVFSSSVTYLITVVAVCWGFIDGEKLSLYHLLSIIIIFLGVYMVNKKKR